MNRFKVLSCVVAVLICIAAFAWSIDRPAAATAPSGVTVTVLSRATVPAFDVGRRFRQQREGSERHRGKTWKIELEATQMIDVVTALFTIQPGGHSGWHTHPGPAIFTIRTGTLTMYDGEDPECVPHTFTAGMGSLEADTDRHIHLLRNETSTVAETVVTLLLPVGAPLRTDLPDPATCSF